MRSPASYSSSFRSGCCCSRRRHCEERRVHPWPLLSVWGRLRSAWRCSQHTGAAEPCLLFECDSPESTSISVLNLFVDKVRPRAAISMPVQRPLPQPNRSKLHISKQTSERTSTQHKKVRARTDPQRVVRIVDLYKIISHNYFYFFGTSFIHCNPNYY